MQLNAYLFFDGRCEEALKFYEKLLGGKIEQLLPYGEHAKTAPGGEGLKDKIIHGSLRIGDTLLMASDNGMGVHMAPQGFRCAITLKTPAETKRVFDGLAEGGQVMMPLEKTFFSPSFGMLTDKFGIPWMVSCAPEQAA